MGQGASSWPAPRPVSPHLGMGANTVRHCSVTPHTQVGLRGLLRGCAVLPSWPQQNTGLQAWRRLELTQDPLGCPRTVRAGVNWGLRPLSTWPRGCHLLCLRCGGYCSLVQRGAGTWWQDMFQQGLLEREQGPGLEQSMGNGGLQLLQAAAAELGCIGLPVLRQLLGAH